MAKGIGGEKAESHARKGIYPVQDSQLFGPEGLLHKVGRGHAPDVRDLLQATDAVQEICGLFEAGHDAVIEADFPRQLAKGTLLHLGGGPGGSAELSTGCVGLGLDVIHTLTGTFNKGLQGFWVGVRK